MRFVIQRVKSAKVSIHGEIAGSIEQGLLVFVGICEQDTEKTADKMIKKLIGLRKFEEESCLFFHNLLYMPIAKKAIGLLLSDPDHRKWPKNFIITYWKNAGNNFPIPNRENSVPICKYPLPTTAHSLFYWIRMK